MTESTSASMSTRGVPWVSWAVAFYGLLGAAALLWNGWSGRPWAYADRLAEARGVAWGSDLAVGLCAAGAVIVASHLWTQHTEGGRRLADELGGLLGPLRWRDCLILAALSGFAEEAFFRGALQPRMGWTLTTILFAAAHFVPGRSLGLWAVFALLAGGLLGALFIATGNLLAPIVAHAAINAVNLRMISTRYGPAARRS